LKEEGRHDTDNTDTRMNYLYFIISFVIRKTEGPKTEVGRRKREDR
jgi:hypothetical protein